MMTEPSAIEKNLLDPTCAMSFRIVGAMLIFTSIISFFNLNIQHDQFDPIRVLFSQFGHGHGALVVFPAVSFALAVALIFAVVNIRTNRKSFLAFVWNIPFHWFVFCFYFATLLLIVPTSLGKPPFVLTSLILGTGAVLAGLICPDPIPGEPRAD